MMYARLLKIPRNSIFLFGPRGTGKSTWIKQNFFSAPYYDLLQTSEVLRLSKNPSLLYDELAGLPQNSWVIIDEVQKVPPLLDEVQRLIEDKKLRFILSGSSARKLKRGGANLLAGRAIQVHMFPLVSGEMEFDIKIPDVFSTGALPLAITGLDPISYLKTYVETYLQEEIRAEALTRNIGNFARFLETAARQNGQITNISNIAREAMINRLTVQGYFDILIDTLIGFWLPAWKLKPANKQIRHPKFYFFDQGVVRALSGRLPYPPLPEELGFLMETFIINELRAYLAYRQLYYPLFYWSSRDGVELDILCETKDGFIAIEIKSKETWDKKFNKGFNKIQEALRPKKVRSIGVYLGKRSLFYENIEIYPLLNFLKSLWTEKLLN